MTTRKFKLKEKEQDYKLKNVLKKEKYIYNEEKNKKDINNYKINMLSKRDLTKFKSNPIDYLNNLNDDNLVKLIQELNYSYYIQGISLVSDELYDYTMDELKKRNSTHPLLNEVGVASVSKTQLPYYMGSMDKIKNNTKTLDNWIKKYPDDNGYIISDKLDGMSGLYVLKDNKGTLYTRKGQDVSHMISFLDDIPELNNSKYKEIAVRGEFIITKDNFINLKQDDTGLSNVRNILAGVFKSNKPNLKIVKYINFVIYECIIPDNLEPHNQFSLLDKLGFNIVYNIQLNKLSTDILSKILEDRRENSEYDIDGIIVTQNKVHKRITSGNPKYSFAFKNILTLKKVEVMVLKVKWNITKDDYIQPVVLFEPVEIDGVIIEKATGFNGKFIKDNKIGPGSKIIIVRRGDVIPHIEEVLTSSETGEGSMPNYKYTWNKTGIEIVLDKSESRVDIIKEKNIKEIENFVIKIKFNSISIGMVQKLYNADINTIYKFLNVTKEDLLKIDGIKEKTANNIINSIRDTMKDIDCIKLMVASNKFGRGFGEKKLKLILDNIKSKDFKSKPTIEDLIKIKGIERKTGIQFLENLSKYLEFVEKNKLKCEYKPSIITSTKNNKLKGLNIVFTGIRDKDLEKYILDNEGFIKTAISGETNMLIVNDLDAKSSKITKATELKIEILTIKSFKDKYKIIN